jgi:hypothetical protein
MVRSAVSTIPRALPWAIPLCPVGAEDLRYNAERPPSGDGWLPIYNVRCDILLRLCTRFLSHLRTRSSGGFCSVKGPRGFPTTYYPMRFLLGCERNQTLWSHESSMKSQGNTYVGYC